MKHTTTVIDKTTEKPQKKNKIKVKSNLDLTGSNDIFMKELLPNQPSFIHQQSIFVLNNQKLSSSNILLEFNQTQVPENASNCAEQIDLTGN